MHYHNNITLAFHDGVHNILFTSYLIHHIEDLNRDDNGNLKHKSVNKKLLPKQF